MLFSRLPVADAAQQYQEVIARIPWVPDPDDGTPGTAGDEGGPPGRRDWSRIARRPATYLLGTTIIAASVAVIAVAGLVAGLVRGAPVVALPTAPPGAAPISELPTAEATPSVVPVARQVFSGRTEGSGVALAVVLDGGRGAAYLCDGQEVEAWFEGEVDGGRVSLVGRNGAVLDATIDGGGLSGSGSAKGMTFEFGIPLAPPPAGVYEAWVAVDGTTVRMGWAVWEAGQQVGAFDRDGQLTAAPPLTLPEGTFEHDGVTHTAVLVSGTDDVVPD